MPYDISLSQNLKQKLISKTNKNVKNKNENPLEFNGNGLLESQTLYNRLFIPFLEKCLSHQ